MQVLFCLNLYLFVLVYLSMLHEEEKIQIVEPDTGEPTGELVYRSEIFSRQLWCRTTNVFILNDEGQILCHKRSHKKERYPGVWCTHFGGHVTEGESFRINAIKEMEEEVGMHVQAFQMIPWRTSKKEHSRIWVRDFLTVYNGSLDALRLQDGEIDEVAWFSASEILQKLTMDDPDWQDELVGFHDFREDYQCLRAALTACLDIGIFGGPFMTLKNWHPNEVV